MATAGKGLPFIGKMNEFLDRMLHPTVQKVGFSRAAIDVVHRGYYALNPVPTTPFIIEAGSTDSLLVLTAHGFKAGDLVRLDNTANPINEFEVVIDEIIDANTVKLAGYLSASLTAGDTFFGLRPIAERFDETGATLAVVASPPISYNRKAAGTTVQTSVLEDLDTPTNSRAMPVVIHSIDGAPIIVNAGDLSVSTSHVNDSMAIGDGTRLVGVTTNNELKTSDADALARLTTIDADTSLLANTITTEGGAQPSHVIVVGGHTGSGTARHLRVDANGRLSVDVNSSALPAGGATAANQATEIASLASIDTKLTSQATAANQTTELTRLGDLTETAPATDTASSGLNGRLQRIAQNLSTTFGRLPLVLGQGTMAQSLKVVIASDQTGVPVTSTPLTNLDVNLGAQTDGVAAGDTSTASLIALLKRNNQNITNLMNRLPALIGINTGAASLSVVPASDAVFGMKTRPLTNSFAEFPTLSTVQTFTAPANAIGGKIQALSDNPNNVRYVQGGVATTTFGIRLEPGRSEDFSGGSNISVISESGTNAVSVNWTIQA